MMKYAIFLLTAVMLFGYFTEPEMVWERRGGNEQTLSQEMSQCGAQALSQANGNMYQRRAIEKSCMLDKGWRLVEKH